TRSSSRSAANSEMAIGTGSKLGSVMRIRSSAAAVAAKPEAASTTAENVSIQRIPDIAVSLTLPFSCASRIPCIPSPAQHPARRRSLRGIEFEFHLPPARIFLGRQRVRLAALVEHVAERAVGGGAVRGAADARLGRDLGLVHGAVLVHPHLDGDKKRF